MQTLRDIAPYASLAAIAVSLALLVLILVLWISVRRLRRAQIVILGNHEQRDIVEHVGSLDSQVRNLREAVEILTDQLDEQKRHLDHALTNRAIVRYDAFRDTGGEQSASFALLDSHRSGVVFSAIAARDFARIYVKHLSDGVADRELSPEEQQAVTAAVPRPLAAGEDGLRATRAPRLADEPRPASAGLAPDDDERRAVDALAELGDPAPDTEAAARASDDDEPFTWDAGGGRAAGRDASPGS
jgi:hypothetical protein